MDDVINVCIKFLTANPSEFIIMNFRTNEQPEKFCTRKVDLTENLSWQGHKKFLFKRSEKLPTVGEIRGKVLLVQNTDFSFDPSDICLLNLIFKTS